VNGLAICAGVGGLELGIDLATSDGYRCVGFIEREAYAATVLVGRMADKTLDPAPIWDDLKTFDGEAYRGKVDIISAGFPCQPWSTAGSRKGFKDKRWIWDDIAEIIRSVGPSLVLLENVPGLISGGGLDPVLGSLAEMGFDAEWGCFTAAETGAPHKRERVFILGYQPWLADSEKQGLEGWKRSGRIRRTIASGENEDLADADGKGERQQKRRRAEKWGRSSDKGEDLADADGIRSEQRMPSDAGTSQKTPAGQSEGTNLADAEDTDGRAGKQGLKESPGVRGGRPRGDSSGCRLFPPGPGDRETWARILEAHPSFEPAIRRMDDGVAPDVDISGVMEYIEAHGSTREMEIAKEGATGSAPDKMRILWIYYKIATASFRSKEVGEGKNPMSAMSQKRRPQAREMGSGQEKRKALSDMWDRFSSWKTTDKNLLQKLPFDLGKAECLFAMANRIDRLRACGNGVVPWQAAHAFRILASRAGIWGRIKDWEKV